MTFGLKVWALGAGVATVVVLGGGLLLGVQPALAVASTANTAADAAASRNDASATTLAALASGNAKLSTMQAQERVLLKAIPRILKPNTFIRRVNEVAAIDDVQVAGVVPGDAVAYTQPPSASGQPTTDGTKPLALAKVDPAITASDFAAVPMSVQVTGTSEDITQFVQDVQTDQRLFLITHIATSSADTTGVSATLNGYVYTLQR